MWSSTQSSRRGRRMSLELPAHPPIPMTAKDSEFLQRRPDLFLPYLPTQFSSQANNNPNSQQNNGIMARPGVRNNKSKLQYSVFEASRFYSNNFEPFQPLYVKKNSENSFKMHWLKKLNIVWIMLHTNFELLLLPTNFYLPL